MWLVATILILAILSILILGSNPRRAVQVAPVAPLQPRPLAVPRPQAPSPIARPFPNTVAAGVVIWGPSAWKQQLLQAQRASLDYTAPSDQMVYTDVRSTYATGTPPGYRRYMLGMAIKPVSSWIELTTLAGIPHPRIRMGDPGSSFPGPMLNRGAGPMAVCFLGELSSPLGRRKLVVVDCVPVTDAVHGGSSPMSMILQAFSIEPGDHLTPPGPMIVSPSVARLAGGWEGQSFNLTVYAGQRDPDDRSHFTIRYTVGGTTSVVEGRLSDDGHVVFTPSDRLDRWPYRGP